MWDRCVDDLADTRSLILKPGLDLTDRAKLRICRSYINDYAAAIKLHFSQTAARPPIPTPDSADSASI